MTEPLPEHALRKLIADAEPLLERGAADPRRIGKYELIGELGRGGMGVVYEARDVELDRRVALKVLLLPPGAGPDLRIRFEREALAAARLNHPNIAAVYEASGEMIAMQLVDGEPLSRASRDDRRALVRAVRDAARAVHYAHEQGIVHRDLKPHNLMLDGDRVVVTDFGLAKETSVESSLSVSGHLLGTPAYMAPEQAEGRVHDADARTDVYGLGATLFDLLAGRPPFVERDVVVLLRQIVETEAPRLRALAADVPHDLETVVAKCLDKDPERRYASAAELADDLTRWLDGRPVVAQPPSLGYRLAKFVQRRRAIVIATAVSVVVVLAALLFSLQQRAQRRASADALGLSLLVAAVLEDARVDTRAGDVQRAFARLDRGIAECERFFQRHEIAEAQLLRGRLLRARGQVEAALEAFGRAAALAPGLTAARLERGLLLVHLLDLEHRGTPLHEVDELAEPARVRRAAAIADLEAGVADASAVPRVDVELARAELALLHGQFAEAERRFEDVLRLDELRVGAQDGLRRVALASGDDARARELAMRAVDVASGFGPAYVERPVRAAQTPGTIRLEGVAGELFAFPSAFGLASSQAAAFAGRSVAMARAAVDHLGDGDTDRALAAWSRAIRDADTALELEPGLAAALNNRAIFRFERARLDPDNREADRRAALEDLRAAAIAAPSDTVIRANRERLR